MANTRSTASPSPRPLLAAAIAIVATALLLLAAAAPAGASPQRGAEASQHRGSGSQHKSGKRHRGKARAQAQRRARRARARRARRAKISRNAVVSRARVAEAGASNVSDVLDAGCEGSLLNWNTAGVGEAIPTVASDIARSGSSSCKVTLSGSQDRSELILGGTGGGSTNGMIEFHEGEEYYYGFSFYIESMVYGEPGAHNLIMQFKGDDDGSPNFGLQLWDYEGDDGEYEDNPKGLWSHGPSMDGDRFLAPVPEHTWHDVTIHFKASGADAGFYELYLNGQRIDSGSGVSMIAPGASYAYIKDGLYRNGGETPGASSIRLDAAKLGKTWDSVQPG